MNDWSDSLLRARKALQTAEHAASLGDYATALQASHAAEDHLEALSAAIVQAERADRDCVLASMRIVRRLVAAPALAWLGAQEFAPGPRANSDEELLDFVTRTAETTYHPVGACRMGSDPLAVVDDELRVHGIAGLRIADASIMPTLTSGNTNAPSIMIGEKAARMALQAAA